MPAAVAAMPEILASQDAPTPAPAAAVPAVAGAVRVREVSLDSGDRGLTIAMHLVPLLGWFVAGPFAIFMPAIFWLPRRRQSPFVDDHGRELLNFGLSLVIYHVVLPLTIIGVVLLPVIWVVAAIAYVRGAMAAGNAEYFRYPITLRLIG